MFHDFVFFQFLIYFCFQTWPDVPRPHVVAVVEDGDLLQAGHQGKQFVLVGLLVTGQQVGELVQRLLVPVADHVQQPRPVGLAPAEYWVLVVAELLQGLSGGLQHIGVTVLVHNLLDKSQQTLQSLLLPRRVLMD